MDESAIQALKYRCIGPPRGGRVVAVAGHPTETPVFYFGACAGGVWKTEDAGTYWQNVSDGYFKTAPVGALAIAESDPNVIYAGMGETATRLDISWGDGVYRSSDGGRTWSHAGLEDSRHVGKIRVHPADPDLVYVAAFGHLFGPNDQRGVYRSRNGGGDWERVLFASDRAGGVDLSMDPNNPRIIYAAIWEGYRNFWNMSSGGPGSGLHKTSDGGDTWEDLSDKPGFPEGIKGKIGVAVSPARPLRVWAIVEAEEAGLYRSDDGGENWQRVSACRDLVHRPFYYCHIFADPQDAETLYILNLKMWKSTDGGATFTEVSTPHGDNHDLWIDPRSPRRMAQGNDGGACVSLNGGESWSTIYNQPTSQFYRISVDSQFPYRVCATQQDNSSISVPSATEFGGITWQHCYPVGTGESGDIAVDPKDPGIVFVGAIGSSPGGNGVLQRYDHHTRQIRLVSVWPEEVVGRDTSDLKYRFNWTFPIAFSRHEEDVLYAAGNILFRTRDEGSSWEAISPDLTRGEPETLLASGGPLTKDASGAESYGTIYAFAESPLEAGVLWAGSDDGLVHVSRDNGGEWREVTPPDLEPRTMVANIEASHHEAGTAYMAATRFKLDDFGAYLYKTEDYGETWRSLAGAFPEGEISRVIREDPEQPGLLYAGTETGIVWSPDDGGTWLSLRNNLPVVPVYDIAIVRGDLVAGTHGRSFWILDDLTPLRELAAGAAEDTDALYEPRTTVRHTLHWSAAMFHSDNESIKNYMMGLGANAGYYVMTDADGEVGRKWLDAGENPPKGAIIYYSLAAEPEEPIELTISDSEGEVVCSFQSRPQDSDDAGEGPHVPAEAGLNRFVWDLRYPGAEKITEESPVRDHPQALVNPPGKGQGPVAPPGKYRVRLKVGDADFEQSFEVVRDPRVSATQADFEAQFELGSKVRDRIEQANLAVDRIRRIQRQLQEWKGRAEAHGAAEIAASAAKLCDGITGIEALLVQIGDESPADILRLPRQLITRLGTVASVVGIADAAPPRQAGELFEDLSAQLDDIQGRLDRFAERELAAFNEQVRESGLPAVMVD